MRKTMMFFAAMTLIAFAYMNTSVLAGGMKDPMGKADKDVSACIGKEVKTTGGEKLGIVRNYFRDSEGRISFAIVSRGGLLGYFEEKVAVPYSALTYDKEKQYFTWAISEDRFANAPVLEDEAKLHDSSFAGDVYRYFGLQPYWTEESTEGE